MKKPITLSDIHSLNFNDKIYCHPDNVKLLEPCKFSQNYYPSLEYNMFNTSIEVITDVHLPRYKQIWEFPKVKFVQYEKSDESWAIPLKHGRWIDSNDPVFYIINMPMFNYNKYYMPLYTNKFIIGNLS